MFWRKEWMSSSIFNRNVIPEENKSCFQSHTQRVKILEFWNCSVSWRFHTFYIYIYIYFWYISFFVFLRRIIRYALTSLCFNVRLKTTSVIFKGIFFVIRMKALDARNFCRQENICIIEIRCFYREPTKFVSLLKITGV